MFLFVTWHGVEVYIPPLHLFSLQTSVLSFLTHNAPLLFPGLPLEALGLKNDKSMDAGECGYCKEMKYFLKRLTHLCFCTEGQDNRQIWDKKEFFFKGRCFGLSSFFCSMHFILFLNAFVYFYVVNFHHRDLEHVSVFDLPLPAVCGIRSSMSFRTSVTEIKVLDQSVGGCSEMLYGMWCVCMSFWCCPGCWELSSVTLASHSSLEDGILQFMYRKKYALLQLNRKFVQKLRGKNTGCM